MKISFISMGVSTDAIGVRILSSLLKAAGHQTQLIFLSTLDDLRRKATGATYQYSEKVLGSIVELCGESDLVGISVMTHHFSVAKDVTEHLRGKLDAPVIWGGIHPTVCPEECLAVADMVCVGEAETSMLELVNRMASGEIPTDVQGFWVKKDGAPVDNGAAPLAEDLDGLPFPDYSFDDHHLIVDDKLVPMDEEIWRKHLVRFFPPLNRGNPDGPAYQVLSARGCPFRCTFCGEEPLATTLYGSCYFRKRSVENLMEELEWALERFPFIGEICFCDDTFSSRDRADLKAFADAYKARIGLPFYILVSPANVTTEKFDLLVDAGLTNVGMGIQSGSPHIIELYHRERVGSVEQSLKAAHILNRHKDRLLPFYDFIVENPYETREDLVETVRLLIDLPRPYQTRVYSLSFFPGTPLFRKAKEDGLLFEGMYDKTFGQRSESGYLSFIIDMNKYLIPQWVLRILISKPFLFLLNRPTVDRVFLWLHSALKKLAMKVGLHDSGLS